CRSTPPHPGGLRASRLQLISGASMGSSVQAEIREASRRDTGWPGNSLAVNVEIEIFFGEGIVGSIRADGLDRCVQLVLEFRIALAQSDAHARPQNFNILSDGSLFLAACLAVIRRKERPQSQRVRLHGIDAPGGRSLLASSCV